MKKLLFLFAAIALVASCTRISDAVGNGNGSGEASDSETTENTEATDEEKEEKDTIKGPATIDNPVWSFDVAEGWLVESEHSGDSQKSSTYLRIKPIQKPEGIFGIVAIKISSYPYESNSVEQSQETFRSAFKRTLEVNGEETGDVTINGVKFAKIYSPEGDMGSATTHLCAPLTPKGNVTIEVDGYPIDDPAIKDMIYSFKLKPAEE
jgi:hypothetical protein